MLTFPGNWRSWGCAPSRVPLWNVGYFELKQLGSVRGQEEDVSLNFSPAWGQMTHRECCCPQSHSRELHQQGRCTSIPGGGDRSRYHTEKAHPSHLAHLCSAGLFPKNAIFSLPLRHPLCALFLTTKSHHSFGQLHFLREICMFSHDNLTVVSLS